MAQKKVSGLTIAISADTSGVTAGLKDITSESISLSKQLKTVDALLNLDPSNTELLDTKQKLLAESIETTRKKLEALKGAQEDVKKAVASGKIGSEEYVAFQKELVQTEKRLKDLEGAADDTGKEEKQLADSTKDAGNEMQTAEKGGRARRIPQKRACGRGKGGRSRCGCRHRCRRCGRGEARRHRKRGGRLRR